MRLPFLHPGPPSGDDHDGLSGGPCASTRLLVGGILWFCLCLGLSLCLASREGGAVLVAEDGQPVLATGDWLRHRDRLDDLMRQTLSRVMPGCRLLTMPGFSEQNILIWIRAFLTREGLKEIFRGWPFCPMPLTGWNTAMTVSSNLNIPLSLSQR